MIKIYYPLEAVDNQQGQDSIRGSWPFFCACSVFYKRKMRGT